MPDTLRAVAFVPELLDQVRDFDYGDEPYQKELAEWMRNDAVLSLARGTKVWLYVNEAAEIVGYGSLGVTRWKYPDPQSAKVQLVIVPAVAIRKVFWGKPDGSEKDDRYSSQVMRHLIAEAHAWPARLPAVGLFVHPDNHAAIKLYERFHFRPFHHSYRDSVSGVTYLGFVRPLVHG
jgi:RimJ/RimL family protein N-acetyltransferase